MAANSLPHDSLSVDPDDEMTTPEVRPAVRAPAGGVNLPGLSSGPDPAAVAAAPAADEDEEVTKVDPRRQQLINPDSLPPPPDLPDL